MKKFNLKFDDRNENNFTFDLIKHKPNGGSGCFKDKFYSLYDGEFYLLRDYYLMFKGTI
jgi:hypothetical protein